MSSTTEAIPAEVLEVLAMPALNGLSEEQVGGQACIWCASLLTTATAVQLGEHLTDVGDSTAVTGMGAFPRGCRSCVQDRAHPGLFTHGSTCDLCRDEQTADECVVGRGLYRLVRDTSRRMIFAVNSRSSNDASGVVWAGFTASHIAPRGTQSPNTVLPRYEQHLSASWDLSGRSLHTPRTARTHVTSTCRTWHVPRQAVESLALITSELATNAVVHAHAEEITVVLGLTPHYVWVSVTDRGRTRSPIIRRTAAEDAEDGRGLCLVEALATRWHATTSRSGTHVWACIALPHRSPTREQATAPALSDEPAHGVAPGRAEDPLHGQLPLSTTPTLRMP
ncbi:ATP-binding protein [Streptomyces gilvifuscus]|uniref:ATP-binding protein n=1 Tax=Streptomyces gilvifuscus TaxID=1550617 RepID=A0ABT5G9Q8_9ACTN|nr:ATP-binding protein [Streptomyces gilvifuscus]MDC2961302.1 ATP-binding protein [Streptomyces gilvifuscus]